MLSAFRQGHELIVHTTPCTQPKSWVRYQTWARQLRDGKSLILTPPTAWPLFKRSSVAAFERSVTAIPACEVERVLSPNDTAVHPRFGAVSRGRVHGRRCNLQACQDARAQACVLRTESLIQGCHGCSRRGTAGFDLRDS